MEAINLARKLGTFSEHRPWADEEVHVALFEPATTLNTGNVVNERTVPQPQRI